MRKDQARVVEAASFILRDENGVERASLRMVREGPQLTLYDSNGTSRAVLRVGSEATLLSFFDAHGREMIAFTSLGHAQMLHLNNPRSKGGISMHAMEGVAGVGLSGGDGLTVYLETNDLLYLRERPCFAVADRRGKTQVTIAVGQDGPELSLRGPNEKRRLRLKVVKGKPCVQLLDGLSREVWSLGADGEIRKPQGRERKRR